jgi:hypothetical protein
MATTADKVIETVNVNDVTCPNRHRVFVVWIEEKQSFAFYCEKCNQASPTAISIMGWVKCILTNPINQ